MVTLRDWQESVESIIEKNTDSSLFSSFIHVNYVMYASHRHLVDNWLLCYPICAISKRVLKKFEKEKIPYPIFLSQMELYLILDREHDT